MRMTIPDFSRSKVLIVGDVMLDRYWQGPTSRISPEAPVPVVKIESIEERPGGAANVALNIAAVGGQVSLLAYTGQDEASDVLKKRLHGEDIDCEFISLAQKKTITKLRVLSRHQQLIRLDFEDGFASVDPRYLRDSYHDLLSAHEVVVLSDYGKGTLHNVADLIQAARLEGKRVLIDPKGTDFSIYKNASLITPNQAEFEAVVGVCIDEDDLIRKGQQLLESLNLEALLVTRSEKGMALFVAGEEPHLIPTRAQEVYDVTGAGDTVIGILAAALAAGTSFIDAVQLANQAAGVVVGKVGTATVSIAELQQAMMQHEPLERGVVDEDRLCDLIEKAKACGEKIVFTNGCFDILHAGHVTYLSRAAELGDRLIVAINDDASVKRLKGQDRPINSVQQRMMVIAALESVDWVVPFSEDTPKRVIELLAPDILVKGGDYNANSIVGADFVTENGGEVVVLDFVDGCSTTAIINSILKKS